MMPSMVPLRSSPHTPNRKLPSISLPCGVGFTSGVKLRRVQLALGALHGGTGHTSVCDVTTKPAGTSGHRVAVTHPHLLLGTGVAEKLRGGAVAAFDDRMPVLALLGMPHLAAERHRHDLLTVAEAEHGNPQLQNAGSMVGASSAYTLAGPPEKMMAAGANVRTSSAVTSHGTISEYTPKSRTRRAMSCPYCAPKSTTMTFLVGCYVSHRWLLSLTANSQRPLPIREARWRCERKIR